jgi:hypothetical protein
MEKSKMVDVICQHTRDGTIIPLRIRLQDEDQVYQTYQIQSYKDITHYGTYSTPDGISAMNHTRNFICKISVFEQEKTIHLFYNGYDGKWMLRW